jgi:hypothetical protein
MGQVTEPPAPFGNEQPIFEDDFKRSNTAAGVLDAGWVMKGAYAGSFPLPPATDGQISNGLFVDAGGTVVYATRQLPRTPRMLQCTFSWVDLGAGTQFTVLGAIISSSPNYIDTMVHVTATNSQFAIQKRIAGGAFINLVPPIVPHPSLAQLKTPHLLTLNLTGQSLRLRIDAAVDVTVSDPDIATAAGPYVAFEHYTGTTAVRWPLSISRVAAY